MCLRVMVVPKRPDSSRRDQPLLCGTTSTTEATAGRSGNPMRRSKRQGSHPSQVILAVALTILFGAIVILTVFLVVVRPPASGGTTTLRSSLSTHTQQAASSVSRHTSSHLPSSDGTYDVIILGRGPAGLSAALFSARSGLSVLVLGSDAGGALSQAVSFDNFPGWRKAATASTTSTLFDESTGGPGWLAATKLQAEQAGATFAPPGLLATDLEVQSLRVVDSDFDASQLFIIHVPNSITYKARSVILATGSSPRRLDLPNEAPLWGKSLHSCAICDGSNYAGKTVLVVGGGDAAIDATLILSRRSKKVYLVHRRQEWRASDAANIRAMERADNIQVLQPYVVKEWVVGEGNRLESAILAQVAVGAKVKNIHVNGAFTMIGSVPNMKWLQNSAISVEISSDGHISVGENLMSTSQAGIFSAGEVVDERYRQAIGEFVLHCLRLKII